MPYSILGDSTALSTVTLIGAQGLFFLLLFIFTLQALFLGYHWFSYGSSRSVSLIALAAYLTGGAVLFITMAGAIQFL